MEITGQTEPVFDIRECIDDHKETIMKPLWVLLASGTVLVELSVQPAIAQAPRPQIGVPPTTPYQGPVLSPYLNLFRRDTLPAINYYGIVRPQFDVNASLQQLQEQSLQNRQELTAEAERVAPTTGHPVQFQNQGPYFLTLNRPTVAGGKGAVTTFRPRPQLPPTGAPTGYPTPTGPAGRQ
jgi:hypothetical protein